MIRFPKIDSGRVRLCGRVVWDDPEDDERLTKANLIRVFVNGFQQIPGVLQPASKDNKRVREFQADILLNEETNNKVGITVPGLEQDAGNRTVFIVDCEKPVKEQRLHLLVLSFKQQDEKKLKDQFVALGSSVSGGPEKYTGPSMKELHKGMGITDAQFDALVGHLKKALEKNGIKPEDAAALLKAVETTRGNIVER